MGLKLKNCSLQRLTGINGDIEQMTKSEIQLLRYKRVITYGMCTFLDITYKLFRYNTYVNRVSVDLDIKNMVVRFL